MQVDILVSFVVIQIVRVHVLNALAVSAKTLKTMQARGPAKILKLQILQFKILHVSTVGTNVI